MTLWEILYWIIVGIPPRFTCQNVDWFGNKIWVRLYPDTQQGLTADTALSHLHRIKDSWAEWESELKQVVVDDIVDSDRCGEICGDCGDDMLQAITTAVFAGCVRVSCMDVVPDGPINIGYDLENMFGRYSYEVIAEINGEIVDYQTYD